MTNPGPSMLRRIAGRARRLPAMAREELGSLAPERWTALRTPPDRRVPPAHRFASYGRQSFVVPPARITGAERIEIGDGVIVLEDCGLHVGGQGRLVLRDRVRLAPGVEVHCAASIVVEEDVATSDYAAIIDTWGPPEPRPGVPSATAAPVVIRRGAYLGWGSVVGPGVTVGEGAYVGEGAVVLEDVAPHAVVFGNPAVVVRR